MHPFTVGALLALQTFHVLFLALHDWIPLGRLNDVKSVRAANSGSKLLAATLISLAPFAVGLLPARATLAGLIRTGSTGGFASVTGFYSAVSWRRGGFHASSFLASSSLTKFQ
jgi:hypothetical protein